ncbi:MAG: ParA family protein [Gammaproteobacteria bacterium]|nr:ParA family protein [Gammaproteobacteria bacterium]
MQTILVINSKGGCGKSTISANLASYYAASGAKTAMIDYDPQGSAMHWLSARPAHLPHIHGIHACKPRNGLTRVWQMTVPPGTECVVIDAPAGVTGTKFQEMINRADAIVVPVTPSSIDIHATSAFVRDLLLIGRIRRAGIRVCVVANRVRRHAPQYEPLKRFLASLGIPFVTSLADSDNYIAAAESGMGIHELDRDETSYEREQWQPLLKWLSAPDQGEGGGEGRPRLNLVSLSR